MAVSKRKRVKVTFETAIIVPRTNGVPPGNGGLEPEPNWRERFKRWIKWVAKGGK